MNFIKKIDSDKFDLITDLANTHYKTNYLKIYNTLIDRGVDNNDIIKILKKIFKQKLLYDTRYNTFYTNKYKKEYNEVLKSWLLLAEKLGLKDSLDLSIFFNQVLFNGYLSFNQEFSYDTDSRINKTGLYYFDVINGSGVCMNFSHVLKDFLRRAGYNASTMLCNCSGPIVINYDNRKENVKVKSKIDYSDTPNEEDYFSHMVTLIQNDSSINDSYYLYDITNRLAFNVKDMNQAYLIGGRGEMCINPILSYQCCFNKGSVHTLEDFITCDSYDDRLYNLDFIRRYDTVLDICNSWESKLEENYLYTKDYLVSIAGACSKPKILKLKNL